MKRGDALARRYARALFQLGVERGDAAGMLAELRQLVECVVESDELSRVLFTGTHPRDQRRGVIGLVVERLGLSAEIRAFSALLVEQNRTRHLPQIADALEELVDRAAGRVEAQVRSARLLSAEESERLRAALSRRVNADVTLVHEVDPALIAGVSVRVGDLLLDGSVRTQLASLRGSLQKGSA